MDPNTRDTKDPIVEAVLDIQVDLPGDFALESLRKCQQRVKKDYPESQDTQHVTGEISIGPKVSTSTSSEQAGYVFPSSDKNQLFQAKRTGFPFNRLAPYPGWDTFFTE